MAPPSLSQLARCPLKERQWLEIPGMCGGFAYWLERGKGGLRLVSESWCRVAGGSFQRHMITPTGSRLVEEGGDEVSWIAEG